MVEIARGLTERHRTLRPKVAELAALALRLDELPAGEAVAQLEQTRRMIEWELLPHEDEEQRTAYPLIEQVLSGENPTGPLIQTHAEIRRLSRLYARLLGHQTGPGVTGESLRDVRRVLYGLHAVLTLHFAQEDELYSLLAEES